MRESTKTGNFCSPGCPRYQVQYEPHSIGWNRRPPSLVRRMNATASLGSSAETVSRLLGASNGFQVLVHGVQRNGNSSTTTSITAWTVLRVSSSWDIFDGCPSA